MLLRPWARSDAPALEPVCGELEVCRWTSVPWVYSLAAAEAWVDRQQGHPGIVRAAVPDGSERPVGCVNVVRDAAEPETGELGYWIVPEARGRGLASRAAALLAEEAFESGEFERIEIAIREGNTPSIRVAERLGAIEREHHVRFDRDGTEHRMRTFVLLPR